MNERIRLLAERAGYKPLPGFDFANSLQEVFLAKFAQLIVQECVELVGNYVEPGSEHRYSHPIRADKEIREHFGVEE